MTDKLEGSVRKVIAGGFFIFIGTILGNLFGFVGKVIVTRLTTPEAFGVFSLCVGVVTIINLFSNFGLSIGIARYSAFYLGQGDKETAWAIVVRVMRIGLLSSIAMLCVFFISATVIGNKLFGGITGIVPLFKIIFLTIPFSAFLEMLVGTGRGYGDGIPKALFMDIARNGLFILALVAFIPRGLSDSGVIWAYVMSVIATAVLAYAYGSRRYGYGFFETSCQPVPLRDILYFSIPMAVLPMMWVALNSMDTMMLGYYMKAVDVGFYNASATLSRLLNPLLTSVVFIFLPIATGLHANRSHEEFANMYHVITKWIFIISVPFVAVLIVFPGELLWTIFGHDYAKTATTLGVLGYGSLSSILLSMNTSALTAAGRSVEQLFAATVTVVSNFTLNIFLIPSYGTVGAAIATSSSMVIYNILISSLLYKHFRIIPMTTDYAKTIAACIVSFTLMFLTRDKFQFELWYNVAVSSALFIAVFFILLFAFKCFTRFDMILFEILEKKTGKNLMLVRGILEHAISHKGK